MSNKVLILFISAVLVLAGGFYLGYRVFHPHASMAINSNTVLTELRSQGFLITQSYIVNQQIEISKSTGSDLKDFFLGQTITAAANVKVSSGVDLTKLAPEDIQVSGGQIQLTLPAVQTQSVELLGNVMLQNKQGILKQIFNSEDGYNEAVAKIQNQARAAAEQADIRADAQANAQKQITTLVRYLYPQKEVVVEFKGSDTPNK